MGETVEFYALLLFQIIQVGIYGVLFSMILQPRRKCPRWGMIIILTVVSVFPTYIKVTSSVLSWKGILAVATINLNYSRSKKIIIETGSGLRSCYFIC